MPGVASVAELGAGDDLRRGLSIGARLDRLGHTPDRFELAQIKRLALVFQNGVAGIRVVNNISQPCNTGGKSIRTVERDGQG